METITWIDNKKLMAELWPAWKPSQAEAGLMNRRWGELHQDKLRDCIEQHRLERDGKPDLSTIHKAYCKIKGDPITSMEGASDVSRTRRELSACVPPSDQELAEWDAWANEVLATATPAEIDAVRQRMPVGETRRVLAIAVDYCRRNPLHR